MANQGDVAYFAVVNTHVCAADKLPQTGLHIIMSVKNLRPNHWSTLCTYLGRKGSKFESANRVVRSVDISERAGQFDLGGLLSIAY